MTKRIFILTILTLLGLTASAQDIEDYVRRQMETYPKSRLMDIYKSCFQDYMGAEHLVSDRQGVKDYLDEELKSTRTDDLQPWYYEPCGLDSMYYRVSLRAVKEGLIPADMLLDAFIRSANRWSVEESPDLKAGRHGMRKKPTVASWKKRWHRILRTVDGMELSLPRYDGDRRFIDSLLNAGKYAVSHSPEYREAYRPHYRIVERCIFEREIKPLIERKEVRR